MTTAKMISYYKKELGNYGIVFKHIKIEFWIFITSPFYSTFFAAWFSDGNDLLWFIAAVMLMILTFIPFNMRAKWALNNIHGMKITSIWWNADAHLDKITDIEKRKLKKHIEANTECFDEEEAREMRNQIIKEAEKRKVKFPYFLSVLVVLCLPVWSAFLSWYFSADNIQNLNEAFKGILATGMIASLLTCGIVIIRITITDIFQYIFNANSTRLYAIAELLNDIERDYRIKRKIKDRKSGGNSI